MSTGSVRGLGSSPVNQNAFTREATAKRAEMERLRQREEHYRSIFELGPVAVYTCDSSGVIDSFNPRAAELWGRTPLPGDTDERFCGSYKLFRPDGSFMPHDQCPMADIVKGQLSEVRDQEVLIERPDGSRVTVIVNIRPLMNESGEVTGAINCFYDITERKEAERLRARLASIVESSDDAIISKDLNGIITTWNRAAEQLFGYTEQEAIGQPVTMLMPPDRLNEEPGILDRVRRGKRIERYETVRRRKDGSLLDISLTVSPIVDQHGRIIGASKIVHDISQRKQMEEALKQRQAMLESEIEERTAALSQLSRRLMHLQDEERRRIARELHDSLGQYLAALGINLRDLKNYVPADKAHNLSESIEFVEKCITETRTISYLLHPPLLDESGLPSAARIYVEGFAKRSGIEANLQLDPATDRLQDDAKIALFRVLQEGLTNVHRHAESSRADIRVGLDAETVTLEIRDYGKGIPEEKLNNFRSRRAAIGVGLPGMRERLQEMGGDLQLTLENPGTLLKATIRRDL